MSISSNILKSILKSTLNSLAYYSICMFVGTKSSKGGPIMDEMFNVLLTLGKKFHSRSERRIIRRCVTLLTRDDTYDADFFDQVKARVQSDAAGNLSLGQHLRIIWR